VCHTEGLQLRRGVLHDFPVTLAAHYDAYQGRVCVHREAVLSGPGKRQL
jgi:hypothetical protein